MRHTTLTQTTHVINFADEEATALGQFLLDLYEEESNRRGGRGHRTVEMTDEVYEIVGDLANHLNGVD